MQERKEIQKIRTYIPGKPIEEVQKELGLKNVIKLASNENTFGPSSIVKKALNSHIEFLNRYPDGSCYELINKLSKKLGVKRENLIIGNGSDEILVMLALAFLNKGDEVIVSEGTFSEYEFASQLLGANIKKVPIKNYAYDIKQIANKITTKTKIIFLANPNNPTGTIFTEKELLMLLSKTKNKILIVLDEAYFDYVTSKEYPNSLKLIKKYTNLVILRTFSKSYSLAGLRIGYSIASPKIIASLNKVRQPFNVNTLAQKAVLTAIDDVEHLKKSRKVNELGKIYLYKELKRLGLKYVDTQSNFIFINLKSNANEVFNKLLKEGLIIRPLSFFGFPKAIRITIADEKGNKKFINAIRKLKIK